ncbi:hypothetical protein Ddc_17500 [Ditylenchus destructor]|nr:hypothetical protein Ddc_17500 [Ditylenchus destructor]
MLSHDLTDLEDQIWLAKAVAVGFLHPAKTLENIKITHERKELTFEVRSLKSKKNVAELSKLEREVSGDEANDQDYRVDKNFGFAAWLKTGNVSTMEAFLSIIDVPPFYKPALNGLLNKVEGMGNDSTDYSVISLFLSKTKYTNGELDRNLFRKVVHFYIETHNGKNGHKGKVGLMVVNSIDCALSPKQLAEKKQYDAFFKSIGFKHLGQDVEHNKDAMAVTFAQLKEML